MTSSTSLHGSPIFGPVHSRRLGVSLGVNLMPGDGKLCSFDCIYCECGLNGERTPCTPRPSRTLVAEALERVLAQRREEGLPLHTITFSGNGEPTLHPQFPGIIDDVLRLRTAYFPEAKVSVLSNATMVHRQEIRDALMKVDNNIQKLDTVDEEYIRMVDRPSPHYNVKHVIEDLCRFNGHVIIQTLFMNGTLTLQWSGHNEVETYDVDNTSEAYVGPWLEALGRIRPSGVMVYTIDRETPVGGLLKAPREELDRIAERVRAMGMHCTVSY